MKSNKTTRRDTLELNKVEAQLDMRNFIYVVAYYADSDDAAENIVSFRHCFVKAKFTEEAYDLGYNAMLKIVAKLPKKDRMPMGLLNDYVAELPGEVEFNG